MIESMWDWMQSWFTPTIIFILINLGIATVAFFSIAQKQETKDPHQLIRTTSLLERFKSFNVYRQNSRELPIHPITTDPEPVEAAEMVEPHDETHLCRTQSDSHPTAGEMPEKLPQKMKKSATENSAFDHFHEDEEKKVESGGGSSTVRERKRFLREDEGVDAKADDFITRFKQQLRLQRLDSILKYKEMLNRGK